MIHLLVALVVAMLVLPASSPAGIFSKKPKKPVARYGVSKDAQRRRADKARDAKWKRIEEQGDKRRSSNRNLKPVDIKAKTSQPVEAPATPPASAPAPPNS